MTNIQPGDVTLPAAAIGLVVALLGGAGWLARVVCGIVTPRFEFGLFLWGQIGIIVVIRFV